ncbi:hypothetical protein HXX76_010917 [Chlamydomonas incerta]|uniref:TIP41-like protein n=1 Tax=Chlamydomonas incerta TaxID=51695 RepID=A0A835VVN2_CHLIN|nr:hypothetical protein HXX76_010917 [Chlamydomonas incerta]|eukprot:KAG2427199.1 hypothetical protein HXX76_010917 [Chlamydomonas incerta]
MVFHLNRVELLHEASGVVISLNAFDALAGWRHEDLPPLQVRVAEEWRRAREHEIAAQQAVQLTYDWTFTTPYTCTVAPPPQQQQQGGAPAAAAAAAATPSGAGSLPPQAQAAAQAEAEGELALRHHPRGVADFVCDTPGPSAGAAAATTSSPSPSGAAGAAAHADAAAGAGPAAAPQYCVWRPTADAIDRGLLMERDPILFYDEVPLYESDLDDNGVCAVTAKLRVMPRCWLVLLRCWVRVDGSLVRLRESRLFCRHDMRSKALEVLQEVRYCEGGFKDLRASGAPDEGPAYQDADSAAQVFQAVAPVGLKQMQLRKLLLPPPPPPPASQAAAASAAASAAAASASAMPPPPPPPPPS